MNIHIEINDAEITIKGSASDALKLQQALLAASRQAQKLTLLKNGREFYVPTKNVLFFESVDGKTWVHTAKNIYEVRLKLYELEQLLPSNFARASKSVIVNTTRIWSIQKNLAGPSVIRFGQSEKRVSVSRGFYKSLTASMNTTV
jgi:DNA-binding LytR/AlgR family response regulator